MKKLVLGLSVFVLCAITSGANAYLINSLTITASDPSTFNGDLTYLTDGSFPSEWGDWKTNTVWWSPGQTNVPYLDIDLGGTFRITDVVISVDNNDGYTLDYLGSGSTWTNAFTIANTMGEVRRGMDTMSTKDGEREYISLIDFAAFETQALRLTGVTPSDYNYSVGEIQIFGTEVAPAPVPEPSTLLLLCGGLFCLICYSRRHIKS